MYEFASVRLIEVMALRTASVYEVDVDVLRRNSLQVVLVSVSPSTICVPAVCEAGLNNSH